MFFAMQKKRIGDKRTLVDYILCCLLLLLFVVSRLRLKIVLSKIKRGRLGKRVSQFASFGW